MSEVSKFYDEFSKEQFQRGINNRHLSIQYHLEKFGLQPNFKVLEIGCGIGTVSELLARFLSSEGSLHAVDISEQSIELARQRLSKYNNVKCEVKDLTKESINNEFDVIVLPDVIEHIPLELHQSFFSNLKKLLKLDGFIFIHIPHPNFLEWHVKIKDDRLQIIDQPIYTNELCNVIYPLNFYIHQLISYSIYTVENDYQIIILKNKPKEIDTENMPKYFQLSFKRRLKNKIKYILRGFK
ncbi:class I SAM-dependent methyltransferase [Marivirga sp. S37H4]|uniref:Class I SAM-dependent methyltransferase n=1 Tax=Marivirga aurantiaca TaxID=2802615 RepID=A0A935CB82_9BACT|nr:class I SAM-dependent methyltransferase [Marivirga aurantiaca]MBK6267010.1 class I SAM-dependent methyltransferase [Marivirga aurantiaca]